MGKLEIFLCFVVGTFIPVQSTIAEQIAKFSQDFIDNIYGFPVERNFDSPYDTIFSSWRTRTPDFHMLAELPPHMKVPKIQVFCNRSQVTLLVDKRFNGVALNGEELQFGDGCYSNGDLENQLVFTYDFAQCGTDHVMQNGLEVFSNSLHFNPRKSLFTWWLTPFTVPISCIPTRSDNNPSFLVPTALPEPDRSFDIKAMNPSWTHTAESNIYQRGQTVYLQVSAKPGPDQQLFIQSCFVSASPDPQTRSRHAVIVNKGCTASLGSHAVTQFVASKREDVVNFVLNTSHLISKVYIHCSVLISDQGITSGSKSCNYNKIQSRWEELSGNVEVCRCCSSRCNVPSIKHLRVDAKAVVRTGPLVFVDKEFMRSVPSVPEPHNASSTAVANSMQSDASDPAVTEYQTSSTSESGSAAPKDWIVSAASFSGSRIPEAPWYSSQEALVVLSRDPMARLTLWLPGQVQVTDAGLDDEIRSPSENDVTVELQLSDALSNDIPELHPAAATDQNSLLNTPTNEIGGQGLNEGGSDALMQSVNFPGFGRWAIPPQLEEAAVAEESQRKQWGGGYWVLHTEAPQEGYSTLPAENTVNDLSLHENSLNPKRDELTERQADMVMRQKVGATADFQPVIRSKLQFSKGMDGLQTLSYEEEVVRPQEGKGMIRGFGIDKAVKRKPETGQKRLLSTFLDLLRRLDKAE